MAATTALKLSGSTDGKSIKVGATSTPGTTIHTAHSTSLDFPYLTACNTSTQAVKLTIEWGGTTSPDDTWEETLAPESGEVVIAGGIKCITNSLVVRAFAATADVIIIAGHVLRNG